MGRIVFRSKVDLWLAVLLGGALLFALVSVLVATVRLNDPALWLGLAMTLAVGGFVVWLFLSTCYELDGRELVVRSGPLRWRIDLATVESVTPTRNPLSSPALSLDRLQIRYGKGRFLLVSPVERNPFLNALARAEPALERHGDGLRRRA